MFPWLFMVLHSLITSEFSFLFSSFHLRCFFRKYTETRNCLNNILGLDLSFGQWLVFLLHFQGRPETFLDIQLSDSTFFIFLFQKQGLFKCAQSSVCALSVSFLTPNWRSPAHTFNTIIAILLLAVACCGELNKNPRRCSNSLFQNL